MIFALPILLLVVAILYMATLGAVLLARFVLGPGNRTGRVAAAALGGPVTVILPVFAIALSDQGARSALEFAMVFAGLLVVFCAVGYPVAYFATRRLDRLTRFDPHIFE